MSSREERVRPRLPLGTGQPKIDESRAGRFNLAFNRPNRKASYRLEGPGSLGEAGG